MVEKSHGRLVAALLSAVLLAGCAMPIQIESRVDPEYDEVGDRVFVVSMLRDVSDRFGEPAEMFIVEELAAIGLNARLHSVDPLTLDDTAALREAFLFSPDAALIIEPTARGGPAIGNITTATIRAGLRDLQTEITHWRAEFVVQSGSQRTPMGTATAQEFAKALVNRMIEDGLLGRRV